MHQPETSPSVAHLTNHEASAPLFSTENSHDHYLIVPQQTRKQQTPDPVITMWVLRKKRHNTATYCPIISNIISVTIYLCLSPSGQIKSGHLTTNAFRNLMPRKRSGLANQEAVYYQIRTNKHGITLFLMGGWAPLIYNQQEKEPPLKHAVGISINYWQRLLQQTNLLH